MNENPKVSTSKSRRRFDCYRDGMTVADYESTVCKRHGDTETRKLLSDLQWDCDRNFIRLERDGRPIDIPASPSMRRP